MPSYDVCIPFHPKDLMILEYCIPSIRQHLPGAKNIYVVSKENPNLDDAQWIPESCYPFTLEDVGTIIKDKNRVGWYFQQLLKLYCYRVLPSQSNNILILDSDVIIKKPIEFFNEEKILLAISPEDHKPYFTHMEKVLPGLTKQTEHSGIVHHIMTNRYHMEEILSKMEEIHREPAWKALLLCVDPKDYPQSGMADYEIYFNYCLKYHPEKYQIRILPFGNFYNFSEFINHDVYLGALHAWMRN
jgi:hypothetical protein